jgi:hypothetical protein|tara:strand:+ start:693 stop:1958 length:1266 start_codon:yes stop_codon:yes gene_type:complete
MASIKEYDKKSKEKLEPLKAALVESKELEKTKVKKAEAAKDKYTLSSSDAEIIKEKERTLVSQAELATDYKNIVVLEELASRGEITQEILTELGIHQPVETISIDDIRAILERREIIAAVKIVNFDLNYNIEIIPIPDVNKMYSLNILEKNIFDVPVFGQNEDTNEFEESHVLKNFIGPEGGTYNLIISGVAGTHYEVFISNETDNTHYNWNKVDEAKTYSNGDKYINTVAGSFQHGFSFYEGIVPALGREVIPIHIPTVTKETIYRFAFLPSSERGLHTDYGNLPMFGDKSKNKYPPYKITQLLRSSTEIKLEDSTLGVGTGDLVINHKPGSKLNSSNTTRGKYDITLTISPRKQILLINSNVSLEDISPSNDSTEVLDLDLIASVKDNVGSIKGTITLGKSSLRPCLLQIRTANIFTTK